MKINLSPQLEYGRQPGSDKSYGPNGHFIVSHNKVALAIISSNGGGWEHVSIHVIGKKRVPTWEEMCWVKDLFWDVEETVVQFHPAQSNYVNLHPYVLHLWKRVGESFSLPPMSFV